jgi:TPR repeat protein
LRTRKQSAAVGSHPQPGAQVKHVALPVFHLDHLRGGLLAVLGQPATKLALARELTARGAHSDAFPLYVKAANAGLSAASYELGRAYLFGYGVPACATEALRWLTRAAEAGEVPAQSLLAGLALQGISQTNSTGLFDTGIDFADQAPDYDQALKWARRASAGGSSDVKALLGFILTAGPAEVRSQEEGEALYRQAAATGNTQGQLGWALALLRRNTPDAVGEARNLLEAAADAALPMAHYVLGVIAESGVAGTQDFVAAGRHYLAGAELGHHPSEMRYGMALLAGRGVEQDAFNGESFLRRAGLAGEPQAAAMVAELYARSGALPPNCFEASIWLRRAAEGSYPGAARALGQLYLRGDGLARDPQEAAVWLRQAAAEGDDGAKADLAQLALARELPAADSEATFAWFQQKADAGDLAATFNIGVCLAEGIGTQRDDTAALALFRQAANCMPMAQYWCGRMLAEGRGASTDLRAARAWYLEAAEQGNADAEVAAGEMLINGRGGPPDKDVAMALFVRAAAAGHPGALLALELLSDPKPQAPPCVRRLAA